MGCVIEHGEKRESGGKIAWREKIAVETVPFKFSNMSLRVCVEKYSMQSEG